VHVCSLARLPINTVVRILLMAVKCCDQVSKRDQVYPIGFTDAYGKTNTLLLDALRSLTVSNCQMHTAELYLSRYQLDGMRHWANKRQPKTSPHIHAWSRKNRIDKNSKSTSLKCPTLTLGHSARNQPDTRVSDAWHSIVV
jgi:hypothetical protein